VRAHGRICAALNSAICDSPAASGEREREREEKPRRLRCPLQQEKSASPADACNLAVEQPVVLPDSRSLRGATMFGCHNSRSSRLHRSLHRRRPGHNRCGGGGWRNRPDGRRRYRGHPGRVANAAGIVDRAVESARIRRPRRNAAYPGVLGRRSSGSCQNIQDRDAQQCHSADRRSATEDRNKLRAPHGSVIPCRRVHSIHGNNLEAGAKVPMVNRLDISKRRDERVPRRLSP